MTLATATTIGFSSDELSKKIVNNDNRSVARSTISTGLGGLGGLIAAEAVVIAAPAALATVAAPVVIPLAVACAGFAFVKSLF